MSFAEYLDWLVENEDLFSDEIEENEERHQENIVQFKF